MPRKVAGTLHVPSAASPDDTQSVPAKRIRPRRSRSGWRNRHGRIFARGVEWKQIAAGAPAQRVGKRLLHFQSQARQSIRQRERAGYSTSAALKWIFQAKSRERPSRAPSSRSCPPWERRTTGSRSSGHSPARNRSRTARDRPARKEARMLPDTGAAVLRGTTRTTRNRRSRLSESTSPRVSSVYAFSCSLPIDLRSVGRLANLSGRLAICSTALLSGNAIRFLPTNSGVLFLQPGNSTPRSMMCNFHAVVFSRRGDCIFSTPRQNMV